MTRRFDPALPGRCGCPMCGYYFGTSAPEPPDAIVQGEPAIIQGEPKPTGRPAGARAEGEDEARLLAALHHARLALRFVEGATREDLESDVVRRYATWRAIDVVGIASAATTPGFRASRPEFPWDDMVVLRERLAHARGDGDVGTMWDILTGLLPLLVEASPVPSDQP